MKTSVIIPAFNTEKTMGETLSSLLKQSIKPKEIIVINDGSTDSTKKIVEEFSKKHSQIKLFNRKNFGISASRNFGAEKASGEIITFLDSDVTVEKKWLEKLLNGLKKDVFCVCGKYSTELNGKLSSDFFSFSVSSSSFQGYNIAFRKKDFFESKGFDKKMKYCEDPEFFLRAFLTGKKLEKTCAESFHKTYNLNKRVKSNFKYSFFDAVLFKKNFSFLINPFNLIKVPENIKMILSFYYSIFFSFFLILVSFLFTNSPFSFLFIFIPAVLGCIKISLKRKKTKYKNNFLVILFYSFIVLFFFTLVKGTGFIIGLIQGKT